MTTVRKLMDSKEKHETYSIAATETVYHAIEMMAKENIGAVLVTEGERSSRGTGGTTGQRVGSGSETSPGGLVR